MLHELGHAWGLGHPWETQDVHWDSVMNYFPKPYNTPHLRSDDTNAIRAAFGSGPALSDAMIGLYTTGSRGVGQSPLYTRTVPALKTVQHGDNLSSGLNRFTIENVGTTEILSPQVVFHLAPTRLSTAGRVQLGTGTYGTMPAYFFHRVTLPTLTIPSATPTGDYYLTGQLTATDFNSSNNWSWADQIVRVKNVTRVLDIRTNIQVTGTGQIGPKGIWTFEFDAVAGQTYAFSLCGSEGGSATFDSKLSIYDGATLKATNDDACGLQSRLMYRATATRRHSVVVGSYADRGQGTFKLAYWRDDTIFRHGFEN